MSVTYPHHAHIVLIDGATAATLAQVLPVLLLTLTVEMRRTQIHRRMPRLRLGVFFLAFAAVETLLVLSIDGEIYPFQWVDLAAALAIFGLLAMLFALSLMDIRSGGLAAPKFEGDPKGDSDDIRPTQ